MADREEVARVLKMVEAGKIGADEAADLLSALDAKPVAAESGTAEPGRSVRVTVTNVRDGRTKVNFSVPLGLVDVVLSVVQAFVPKETLKGVDLEEIKQQLRQGLRGRLIDIEDHDDGEHVVIEVV